MRPSLRSASLLTAFILTLAGCGGGQGSDPAPAAQHGPRQFSASQQSAATATITFSGPLASYTITKSGADYLVTHTSGLEPPRTVDVTARLRFSDTSLSLDADGLPGKAYRLYRAALARTPDTPGLGYWLSVLDQGVSMRVVAQGFVDSAEYKNLYAGATTNRAIVDRYYQNVLNRPGEQDGLNYWVGILDSQRETVTGVLISFSDSTENINGTAAAIQNGIRYLEPGVSYDGVANAFPVRAAYRQRAVAGGTDYLSISGSCNGYAAFTHAVPVSSTFEGGSALAAQTTFSLGLTTCSPASLGWTATDYFDSEDALLGHVEPGTEYDVASGAQRSLPVAAKIGDTGVYAVQSRYSDSSKQSALGQRVQSYAVEADGNSRTSAILKLSAVHSTAAGLATLTRVTSYRIGSNGTLEQLAVDETYSSGVRLVYTQSPASAQPAGLIVTDTALGSGAVAQNGQTLSMHYTGWLYDPSKPDFKGAQFDSSIGKSAFSFPLGAGRVIAGWDQGVAGMRVGGKRTLLIPSVLGYGTSGAGAAIPGNAALVFDVELLSVN